MRTTLATTIIGIALLGGAAAAYADTTPSISLTLISNPGAVQPGSSVAVAAGASGFINPTYAVSDSFAGSSVSSSDMDSSGYFSWTPSANDAGTHQLTITASDSYGHSASASISILVAAGAVFIQNVSPGTTIGYGRTLTFTISAPGYISPSYIINDTYAGSSVSGGNVANGAFSWTPAVNQQGQHMFTIYVNDAYGHSGAARQSVVVTSPQMSVYGVKPVNSAGVPLTISAIASGLATTTAFSVADSYIGTTTVIASDINSAGMFSWTPSATDLGLHTLTFFATDGAGNAASTTQQVYIVAATPGTSTTTTSPTVPATVTANAATTASSPSASTGTGYDGYVFTKVLSQGMSGAAVTELQKRLAYFEIYSGPITGYFGALTAAAVRKFQAQHNFAQVGYTGPMTRVALNSL